MVTKEPALAPADPELPKHSCAQFLPNLLRRRAQRRGRDGVLRFSWGYNARTASDADSTAFAVRALLRAGYPLPAPAGRLLAPLVDERGRGNTYRDPTRMGAWAGTHPDVTPSIGMALWEADADSGLQERLARASLEAHDSHGVWAGFWWCRPYYPTWLNLQ